MSASVTGCTPPNRLKYILSWLTWPALFIICMSVTAWGFAGNHPMLVFNAAYLFLAVCLFFLERTMPHEEKWMPQDGQLLADLGHTLMSKGTVQGLLIFGGVIGITDLVTPVSEPGGGIWPRDWPMWTQVIMGLAVAEFGLYWAHRAAHEVPFFWRFHAVHHSVTKLWIINTGRFHFIDSLISIVLAIVILVTLGAPLEVVKWQAATTAFIGMLTHCNVEMRFGPISWIFNTPGLHRWHHSKNLKEGNRNYGENLVLWDQLFGTYYNEKRRPPADIGMGDVMPERFIHQIIWPFLTPEQKQKIMPGYVHKPFVREDKKNKRVGNSSAAQP